MNDFLIRDEAPQDSRAIARVTRAAFEHAEHTSHTEHLIVDALRAADALTVSLVAEREAAVIGHVAISPVTITRGGDGWYGLGPVSVLPEHQGRGVGGALIRKALQRLRDIGASGCVVLGEPAYYGRFGFRTQPGLVLPGVPAEYFQVLVLNGDPPHGEVAYHTAFETTA